MNSNNGNDLYTIIAQAISEMEADQGKSLSADEINLAELQRRTGITRARLRRLKSNNFKPMPHGRTGQHAEITVLSGFTGALDNLLRQGVTNSVVCLERLQDLGYSGGKSQVKEYISKHKDLVPAKRQIVDPQGNRGFRYHTGPGEAYQMDWGFITVYDEDGRAFRVACFAMICHHCGKCYVEFFPNAKQENLFIGMLHAFAFMGVPKYILTDNMKSVVIRRDFEGYPVWQADYESFMNTVGFQTKLCKPRHPFTKGKVERLIRFVKDNFLAGRTFLNLTDLNRQALEWCEKHNGRYHQQIDDIPDYLHASKCMAVAITLVESRELLFYLCPPRRISFDGFVNYEGRRFGVPFRYAGRDVRVCRQKETLYIYSADFNELLVTHEINWGKRDQYCAGQFAEPEVPEELPTAPVTTSVKMLSKPSASEFGFDKFNFDEEDPAYE
ncbi:MAG TPA: IS21 family transposase [Lachnospiraceae bacterium]|nr:IS21 family transposase [Lachnospiraceae bacterium]